MAIAAAEADRDPRHWARRHAPVHAALFGVCGFAALGFASAQSTDQPAGAPQVLTAQLQEVIVTAEKRESTAQRTPMSITAVQGIALQAAGISDMTALAQQVPGVSFKTAGPGQTEFEMRGLTSTGGESPTVGLYLDDVMLTPAGMAQNGKTVVDPSLFDLNRVEVLRGPQGTLYGAGSMGGTIKFVTNSPDPRKYSADAEGILSDTSNGGGFNHTENAMVNLPLAQNVAALRLVGTDQRTEGWIDRVVVDPFPTEVNGSTARGDVANATPVDTIRHSNTESLRGGRAELLLLPTERLKITGGIMHQRIAQDGANTIDGPPLTETHYQPYDVSEPFSDSFNLYSVTAQYDFNAFQLVSATGYWDREQDQTQEISEAMQFYIGGLFGPPASFPFSPTSTVTEGGATWYGLGAGSISEDDATHQFSEELRLTSSGSGPLQWLAGAYYSSYGATSHVFSYYPISTVGFDGDFGTNNLADNHRKLDIDQYALFGQATYDLPHHLQATAGARYYTYHSNSATSVSGVSASGTTDVLHGTAQNSGVTPKVTLAYVLGERRTLYVTISKGFRPGGPNSPIPVPPCSPAPKQFGPDSIWNYEMGDKERLLNDRLAVSGDVYYENWSDVQQQVAPGCGYKFTANAGKARVYGAELELSWMILPGLVLAQNAGYTHATNGETVPEAGVTAGERLLDVPQWTADSSITYRIPVGGDRDFVMRANNSYVGSIQDITFSRNTLPAYDLVTLRLGLESDRWSAYLFSDNLTNRRALLSDTGALSANILTLNRIATHQPRTVGVDLNYRF
jgi:outer membrane receptor protein involved in Fe transport